MVEDHGLAVGHQSRLYFVYGFRQYSELQISNRNISRLGGNVQQFFTACHGGPRHWIGKLLNHY